jgi:hypothetical protein
METTVNALNQWTASLQALAGNMRAKHRELKKDGTVSMSRANFRQIVSTRGVTVPVSAFDRLFDQAIDRADLPTGFIR